MKDIFCEIHQNLPTEGPGRNRYTRKAFRMLPKLAKPRILDIGCGTGTPTLELARLSEGEIIGIDVHQPFLDELTRKAEEAGLSERVKAMYCSMFDIDFPAESFDVIWAEGSIFIVGFERGLGEWRRLIGPKGFVVVHEMVWLQPDPPREIYDYWKSIYPGIGTVQDNVEHISGYGYDLLGCFTLPEDSWLIEYYGPLEERIKNLRQKYTNDSDALAMLDKEHREIDLFTKYKRWYGSAFFIMQKR
jgi:SAM-dependent methyltransferase